MIIEQLINRKAVLDVDCGIGLLSEEDFFDFLESMGVEKLDTYYKYYIHCYNAELDLVCEWISAVADCFD